MSTTVTDTKDRVPALQGPRLPYHPALQDRFGIDKASWKALCEAIFPNAVSVESIVLALSYCKARNLDPFKRNVHIVPIWNKELGGMVDTIWPGIGELRTTAFRTGEYSGRGATVFGPDVTKKVGSLELTFPEWAQVSVFRTVKGQRVEFHGPRVYWLETYATIKRNDDTPNDMWANRPRGQIDKCAEAAALRAGFPEEVGCEYTNDEVQHRAQGPAINVTATTPLLRADSLDALADHLAGGSEPAAETKPNDDEGPSVNGSDEDPLTPEELTTLFRDRIKQAKTAAEFQEIEIDLPHANLGEAVTNELADLLTAQRKVTTTRRKPGEQGTILP